MTASMDLTGLKSVKSRFNINKGKKKMLNITNHLGNDKLNCNEIPSIRMAIIKTKPNKTEKKKIRKQELARMSTD